MEAGADTQQSGETAVSESEAQHITLAQVNIITTVEFSCYNIVYAAELLPVKYWNEEQWLLLRTVCNFAYRQCVILGCHGCRHP